jgi:hypothetical protein
MKYTKHKKANTKSKRKKSKHKKQTQKAQSIIKGGDISCIADPKKFPKCGKEGCVYLNGENTVTKQQWKPDKDLEGHLFSVKGQQQSVPFSPIITDVNDRPCDVIYKKGNVNTPPCFVKRYRFINGKKQIVYEEESKKGWCLHYKSPHSCVVDDVMYDKFKTSVPKVVYSGDRLNSSFKPEDLDAYLDGDYDGQTEDDLGDVVTDYHIPTSLTAINPIWLTHIRMNRIKGMTIFELMSEMFDKLGEEKTMSVSTLWESEKELLIQQVSEIGYVSEDFNEHNIMIDVDNETLCPWIDDLLKQGIPVTPELIKEHFQTQHILKIVDWGLLRKTK